MLQRGGFFVVSEVKRIRRTGFIPSYPRFGYAHIVPTLAPYASVLFRVREITLTQIPHTRVAARRIDRVHPGRRIDRWDANDRFGLIMQ
jgi:hypothetical protein